MRDARKDLELCNKATPGPWSTGGIFDPQSKHPTMNIWGATPPGKQSGIQVAKKMTPENAAFGAMARTALPYWIQRAEKMKTVLLAYEQWEADLLMCDDAWQGSLPTHTQEIHDKMIELQEMRNDALGRFADNNPELLE